MTRNNSSEASAASSIKQDMQALIGKRVKVREVSGLTTVKVTGVLTMPSPRLTLRTAVHMRDGRRLWVTLNEILEIL
jgi:hypothetical protein